MLLLTCMTDFLPQTTKRDVSQSLFTLTASFFHTIKVNGDWSFKDWSHKLYQLWGALKNVNVLVLNKLYTNIHVPWLWLQPFWPSDTWLAMWNVSLKACVQINVFMWCVLRCQGNIYDNESTFLLSYLCTLDGAWALCIKPQSFSSNMTAWLKLWIIFYTINFKLTYNPFTSEMA